MIVSVKMSKRELEDIYKFHSSLVKKFGRSLNISDVYVSKADLKKLEKSLKQKIKKEKPYLSGQRLNEVVSFNALNMIPNGSLADTLKEGYVAISVND
jgi:hypothetical protein